MQKRYDQRGLVCFLMDSRNLQDSLWVGKIPTSKKQGVNTFGNSRRWNLNEPAFHINLSDGRERVSGTQTCAGESSELIKQSNALEEDEDHK